MLVGSKRVERRDCLTWDRYNYVKGCVFFGNVHLRAERLKPNAKSNRYVPKIYSSYFGYTAQLYCIFRAVGFSL